MAVVKQKFVTVSASLEHLDGVIEMLSEQSDFLPEEPCENGKADKRAVESTDQNPYIAMKEKLAALSEEVKGIGEKTNEKKKGKGKTPATQVNTDVSHLEIGDFSESTLSDFIDKSAGRLDELIRTCDTVKRALDADKKILEQLGHLGGVDVHIEDLFNFKFFKLRLGYLPAENYDKLKMYFGSTEAAIFTPFSEEKDYVWGMYSVISRYKDEVDSTLSALGFERIIISDRVSGTPDEAYAEFSKELSEIEQGYNDTLANLKAYAAELSAKLPAFSDKLEKMSVGFEIKRKAVVSKNGEMESFSICGWIPEKKLAEFESNVKASGAQISVKQAHEAHCEPPVKLKNPGIFKPFESFVTMYGSPAYNEIDPTIVFALTYSLFFGLMFGDIGQGAVIFIVGMILYFWKKVNIGGVFAFIGVFSVAGGFLYGSIFGNEEIIHGLFVPGHNINGTLFAAVGIGVAMIVICSLINIINGIKQRKIDKFLLSPNGIVGLIFYVCALIMALAMFDMIKAQLPTGALIAVIAVCAFLLFIREPLTHFIEKKKDWLPKNIGESAAENFFELFEVVLSFVTNTISFIRIGAFALSHAGMMTVVYLLAENASGGHNPIVLIIGNALVIGLEGMIVGIQVLRLEFYELFSRFYSGTGRSAK